MIQSKNKIIQQYRVSEKMFDEYCHAITSSTINHIEGSLYAYFFADICKLNIIKQTDEEVFELQKFIIKQVIKKLEERIK